jgi:hypothetical protein
VWRVNFSKVNQKKFPAVTPQEKVESPDFKISISEDFFDPQILIF